MLLVTFNKILVWGILGLAELLELCSLHLKMIYLMFSHRDSFLFKTDWQDSFITALVDTGISGLGS